MDGTKTKDRIRFSASFESPDMKHSYRVVVKRPLPHGFGYPTFGGVVTDHLMHGGTGIGTKLMPTEYGFAAFWGVGDVYTEGHEGGQDVRQPFFHVMFGNAEYEVLHP